MRVTRESLIRIAKETAQERAFNDKAILAAYLTGSLVADRDPLLGGTADIDLVLVYAGPLQPAREFVRLTPDYHIDIMRRSREDFKSPRELRGDPWLGYELYAPLLLYEREKFFDFVQASLRAGFEFEKAPLTLQRCRTLYNQARKGWMSLMMDGGGTAGPQEVKQYLHSLYLAANAVAELGGPPIPERRLLLEFEERAGAVERPGMQAAMIGLLGASQLEASTLQGWLSDWKSGFTAAAGVPGVDPRVHPARLNYYEKAIRAMLESDHPGAALWPLVHTWTLAAAGLDGEQLKAWNSAFGELGLTGEQFPEHLEGMDQVLDEIDVLLDEVAAANGLEPPIGI
jgi:hypothetical protein